MARKSTNAFFPGLFNGGVIVVDTAQSSGQEIVFTSESGARVHSEPVMKVQWHGERDMRGHTHYSIVSVAGDGRVLSWKLPPKGNTLVLSSRLGVNGADIKKSQRSSKGGVRNEAGLISLSFFCEDTEKFVVGSESGALLGCSLSFGGRHAPRLQGSGGADLGESNPVVMGYAPHVGAVYGLSCSPFHRNIFASGSRDGSLQLRSALQAQPLHTIEPSKGIIFDIAWSPHRPLVLVAATADGSAVVYDLAKSRVATAAELQTSDAECPVYGIAFNRKRARLLATGDASGTIKVCCQAIILIH